MRASQQVHITVLLFSIYASAFLLLFLLFLPLLFPIAIQHTAFAFATRRSHRNGLGLRRRRTESMATTAKGDLEMEITGMVEIAFIVLTSIPLRSTNHRGGEQLELLRVEDERASFT
jgi:hypothetical protein